MSLTFESARILVEQAKGSRFGGPGDFFVATWGFETASHFIIPNGAREAVLENDGRFADVSENSTIVDKLTGVIEEWPSSSILHVMLNAKKVGSGEPSFEG